MNDKLIAAQRECYAAKMYEAASTISAAADKLHEQDLRIADLVAENERRYMDCRNELCMKCGRYREAHKGACDGCRWKEMP